MTTLCRHDRETLIWACSFIDGSAVHHCRRWTPGEYEACEAVADPAKLAELIAAELLRRGVEAEACELFVMFREQPWPMVQVEDPVYMHKLVSADMKTSRARLLRLLRLPEGASTDGIWGTMYAGEQDPPSYLPAREQPEPRRFDPDPDRERE